MKYVNYIRYDGLSDEVSAIRPAHRQYLAELAAKGKIVASGPFSDFSGALFVYDAESLDEARQLADNDPYVIAGVLTDRVVNEWTVLHAHPDLLTVTG